MRSSYPLALLAMSTLLFLSCKTRKSTCAEQAQGDNESIVSGQKVSSDYPKSIMLSIDFGISNQQNICTGSFISDRYLLTAAHCLLGAKLVVLKSPTGIFASRHPSSSTFTIHSEFKPKYVSGTSNLDPSTVSSYSDLGIVTFPAGTASSDMIATISTTAPKAGDAVTLVGFGMSSIGGPGAGEKRMGKNKIYKIDGNFQNAVTVLGPKNPVSAGNQQAVFAQGDSGGGLYNSSNEIIATAHKDVIDYPAAGQLYGVYTNLSHEKAKSFLKPFIPTAASSKIQSAGAQAKSTTAKPSTAAASPVKDSGDKAQIKSADKDCP